MKIGVVGSINMDLVVQAPRIPHKGETLMGTRLDRNPGGKGANQAVAAARLGGEVVMFGAVGQDENGAKLLASMAGDGVDTTFVKVIPEENTGIAMITVGDNDNTIIVVPGANNCVDRAYIDSVRSELLSCGMVILQHEIPQDTNEYVAALCAQHGIEVILNPAPARQVTPALIEQVTYLTPNEHEAALIFGEDAVEDAMRRYPGKLLVTCGEKGIALVRHTGEGAQVPARTSRVVDTTGAGDTFNGAFAYARTQGMELLTALRFANTAAGLSTEKAGAQGGMPTREQVEADAHRAE